MSNLVDHARRELEAAGLFDKDSDYNGMIGKAVVELMEVFAKQGHSGCSASIVSDLFNRLAGYEVITPLTGEDDEWNDISHMGETTLLQNNRNSAVFKDKNTGRANYVDAIIWRTQTGTTYTGPAYIDKIYGKRMHSSQYIKSFPFQPKKFYIDVIETEVKKNDWEKVVKSIKDLDAVWEYYDGFCREN